MGALLSILRGIRLSLHWQLWGLMLCQAASRRAPTISAAHRFECGEWILMWARLCGFCVGFDSPFVDNCGDACSVQLQVGVLQQYLQRTVPSVASGHKYRRAFEYFT
jgi:hypothetical protein